MRYTYQECLDLCLKLVLRYGDARRNSQWDYWEFQDIRDDLAEALVYFDPIIAELRADAEQAEVDRKDEFAKRRLHWRREFEGKRGTASDAGDLANIDIKPFLDAEIEANKRYQKARGLKERIDQVLNGISSRLKPLDKYDSQNQTHGKELKESTY